MAYPLEARLRPAHELGAASVSALGAALILSSPGLFLISPPWHLALAGLAVRLWLPRHPARPYFPRTQNRLPSGTHQG